MKLEDANKLPHGLYKVFWHDEQGGGMSLASVGSKHDGQRWICCANWTSALDQGTDAFGVVWGAVEKVIPIQLVNYGGQRTPEEDRAFRDNQWREHVENHQKATAENGGVPVRLGIDTP
jgi:hypothetical protein